MTMDVKMKKDSSTHYDESLLKSFSHREMSYCLLCCLSCTLFLSLYLYLDFISSSCVNIF